eukprot:gb/GECH01013508.1/.p1 GENE.gb/GECH01013508.1/~~gb/GECH01013508.1/.p1  ORF type:complete len:424 (+),score=121.75 gb/GECH01013508.1/:1-1272(+)
MSQESNQNQSQQQKSFLDTPQYAAAQNYLERNQQRRSWVQQNLPRFGERFLKTGNLAYDGGDAFTEEEREDPSKIPEDDEDELEEAEENILEQDEDDMEPDGTDEDFDTSTMGLEDYREYLDIIGAPQLEESQYVQEAKRDLAETFGGDTEHLYRYEDVDRALQLKRAVLDNRLSFDQAREVYSALGSFINTDTEMFMWPIAGLEQYEEIAGQFTDQYRVGDGGEYGPPPVWTGAMYWGDEEYRRIRSVLNRQTWGKVLGSERGSLDPEDAGEENFHCTHTVAMGLLFGLGAMGFMRIILSKRRKKRMPSSLASYHQRVLPFNRMRYPQIGSFDGLSAPTIIAKPLFVMEQYGPIKIPVYNRYRNHFAQAVFRKGHPRQKKRRPMQPLFMKRRKPRKSRMGGLGLILFFGVMGLMECGGQFDG